MDSSRIPQTDDNRLAEIFIVIGIIIFATVIIFAFVINVYGFKGANITDNLPRFSILEQEDMSVEVHRTVNGNTIQVAGYDNLSSAIGGLIVIEALRGFTGMIANLTSQFVIPVVYASTGNLLSGGVDPAGGANPTISVTQPQANITFSALYENGTSAFFSRNVSSQESDKIILALNLILSGSEIEGLDELVPEEEIEEEALQEERGEEESSGDNDDGGGSESIEPDESQEPEQPQQQQQPDTDTDSGGETDFDDEVCCRRSRSREYNNHRKSRRRM